MIGVNEGDFPRGGKKISTGVKRKLKDDTLFGSNKKPKKEIKEKKVTKVVENDVIHTNCKMLSRQDLIEGMTLLACVKKITDHALEVELPGLIIGKVMIDSISDNLVKTLREALTSSSNIKSVSEILKTLFHYGQYVPLKIKTIQATDEKSVILGSISPRDINCYRVHNSFKKGELLWATVASELDHGYQLDCGVANCRIFLPNQSLEENTKLEIGQPIWCSVHRVDSDKAASTLRVGAKRQHIDTIFSQESTSLNSILPGTKVEVYVDKVAKNGIYCKFLENYTGFIHESQLEPVIKNLNKVKEATILCAYLLYVENITKIAHLSLRSLNSNYEVVFERGTKVSAEVTGRNEIGIYFKLNNKQKGWISNKRILSISKTNSENDNLINEKFSKGSKHQCVVLSYNHMDRVYVCGIEKELLKEKYFSSKDFKVGEVIEGRIEEIKSNGIVVGIGQVKGFIPNIHLTDALYSENLKKKFVTGKKIQAKVFSCEKSVILTLKSAFMKEDAHFDDLKAAHLNGIYPALVLKAKTYGLVITFYNNIEGYVPFKEFNFKMTQEYKENPSSYFYSGQVIKVRVVAVKSNKIIASLKLSDTSSTSLQLGKIVDGIVTKERDNGIDVFISELNMKGFVPVEHLSVDLSLCHSMLRTFKKNDEIPGLMILKVDETQLILSKREAKAYERSNLKVPKFQDIKKNTILRCSVESIEDNGIILSSPIKNFNKTLFVKQKNTSMEKNFEIQQALLGKVSGINRTNESIELSLKPESVFDNNIQNSVSLFISYLEDEEYLRQYGYKNNWSVSQYDLCEIVWCTVVQSTDKGCLLELPNGSKGLVVPSLSTVVKKGEKIKGMILGYNYQLDYVELCLNPTIMKQINPKQDGVIPEDEPYLTVNKLLTREQYILAVTRETANRQLVYIPLRLCENDTHGDLKKYYENDSFKVNICGKYGEKLIGFHRKLKYSLDYKFILNNTNWSELKASILSDEENISDEVVEQNITEELVEEDKSGELVEESVSKDQPNVPVLSSIANFFSMDTDQNEELLSDDDNEDEIQDIDEEKKTIINKKHNDNRELNKSQFKNLEHYEMLVMNNPNSSSLWLEYIDFCLSMQEFEKARNIGKRALASINITCEDDKLNIWMSLLNIENLYGGKESFESVFEEAVRHNDALKVYTRVVDLLLKSGKHVELEEKIRKMKIKFKQEPSMWVLVAKSYYLMGNIQEARNVKKLSFKSITTKKEQYNLILKFAILEFTYGEIDNGILIFESLLVTYPNKIGAWLVYIDQLISKRQIKEARDVLNRAISLSLPVKSMKILYHKYRTFEENHGTPETLSYFKEKSKVLLEEKLKATL